MSDLADQLKADLDAAKYELSVLKLRKRRLIWQIDYINKLLSSATAPLKFEGKTIAEVAVAVLSQEGKPLSAMEIAKRAMAGGWEAENAERARSHFSAVISKDLGSPKPRFWQVERGAIGLAEWQDRPATAPSLVQLEQPFEDAPFEEQKFKDDDIPF
jgi:hypothetical protein